MNCWRPRRAAATSPVRPARHGTVEKRVELPGIEAQSPVPGLQGRPVVSELGLGEPQGRQGPGRLGLRGERLREPFAGPGRILLPQREHPQVQEDLGAVGLDLESPREGPPGVVEPARSPRGRRRKRRVSRGPSSCRRSRGARALRPDGRAGAGASRAPGEPARPRRRRASASRATPRPASRRAGARAAWRAPPRSERRPRRCRSGRFAKARLRGPRPPPPAFPGARATWRASATPTGSADSSRSISRASAIDSSSRCA